MYCVWLYMIYIVYRTIRIIHPMTCDFFLQKIWIAKKKRAYSVILKWPNAIWYLQSQPSCAQVKGSTDFTSQYPRIHAIQDKLCWKQLKTYQICSSSYPSKQIFATIKLQLTLANLQIHYSYLHSNDITKLNWIF